ncbi:transposase [Putridiphycobacter roseus]|uniref:Transposase n=1 Tax=Putridiphycobacter roseus TaxID=2219161 RepID=A0A2W1MW43_9FLAO|nr:transposase [Putridiphycobacter roseus]PZE15594.1 transposase [Putridiphycobacter roseus]
MKANIKLLRKQRKFSVEFKRSIVKEFESGKFSVLQLEKLHGISNPTIYSWIYKFSNFNERGYRILEMKDSAVNKLKALEKKIKELEQAVGQKQIKIDYLEKMIDIAKDDLDIDIKKNYSTQPPIGSDKIKKK